MERRFGAFRSSAILHIEGGGSRKTSADAVARVLASGPKSPIAIAAVNDESALGAADALAAHRSRRRAAIVGHGGSPELIALARGGSSPCIGTVNFHAEAYGPALIDFVFAVLQGRAASPAHYMPHSFEGAGGPLPVLSSAPRRSSI
jgi:ribose transport system substrate-binding protein